MASILKVPGIEKMPPEFLRVLAFIAEKNGFDVDGIAAVISHESRFDPRAKSPNSTATGLIQFIESTARSLGTSTADILGMTATQQLILVERYFQRFMPQRPGRPEDYILATYGRVDGIGKPDDYPLDRRDSEDPAEARRYAVNSALDRGGDGIITVGDLRRSMAGTIGAARGERVPVPPKSAAPPSGGILAGAAAVVAAVGAVALWVKK